MFGLREAYKQAQREREALEARLRHTDAAYLALLDRHHGLVEILHRLKRDGFAVPDDPVPPAPFPELPLAVQAAIQARALDAVTGKHLEGWARLRLEAGDAIEDIERRIWDGDA